MRDGAKSRFVALFSARMMASAINSENCRRGFVVPVDGSQRQYCFTLVLRDLEVESFVPQRA